MDKYLITYDLKNTPLTGYAPLHEAIKGVSNLWWHYLESTWIIKVSPSKKLTADSIYRKLVPMINTQTDRLLVIKIDVNDKQGWLPQKAWDWLNSS